MKQSLHEQAQLVAAWEALPEVVAFQAAMDAHIAENGLGFDVAGMNAGFAFAAAWRREHGPLPPSGVIAA
jgi:hypothetical protein